MTTHQARSVMLKNLEVRIEQTDFTTQQCDVMVVSVSKALAHEGAAAKAVEKIGGSPYKRLVKESAPSQTMHSGEIVPVFLEESKLNATYVLLVVHPDSFSLTLAYKNILSKAAELNIENIIIPGLGCGGLQVPADVTARKFAGVLSTMIGQNALGSLKVIRIVDRDITVFKAFVRALRGVFPEAFTDEPDDDPVVLPDNERSLFERSTRVPQQVPEDDTCSICLDALGNPISCIAIKKCDHLFHAECFKSYLAQSQPRCPYCQVYFAVPMGNQSEGTMTHRTRPGPIPGFHAPDHIEIYYNMDSGIQGPNHLRPGVHFHGTSRTAYLPNTPEGRQVLRLLECAFRHKLIFTVGDSVTSGAQNVVVWNNIHHKTNITGGSAHFGYPDDTYLERVTVELSAQGITADMLS